MPHYRSRAEIMEWRREMRRLRKENKHTTCVFCAVDPSEERFVRQTRHFFVIKNIFPYSQWDGHDVTDHLLIVPKIHTDRLSSLDAEAAEEYLNLVGEYEVQGYNFYGRAPHSKRKSIEHQHTHLIQIDGRHRNLLIYSQKPYIRFTI